MTADRLIAAARRYRGRTRETFAANCTPNESLPSASDIASSDITCDHADRILCQVGYQLSVLPTRRGTAVMSAEDARQFLHEGNHDAVLRVVLQFAADLAAVDDALAVALCITPPAPTGSEKVDALIAGITRLRLQERHLPLPLWLNEDWRRLDEPWDMEPVPSLQAEAAAATPPALLRHGIHLHARELIDC